MTTEILVLVGFAALFGVVFVLSQRRRAMVYARRAGVLSDCAALFEGVVMRTVALGFPRMAGTARGLRWDVQVVPDALGVRKLPALWLMVSLPEPMPVAAALHLMLRPTGGEGFTRFRDLAEQVALPAGFPEDAGLRTDDRALMPSVDLLRPVLALGQDRLKEIIISPKGLRVTLLLEEADRGNYLILRQTDLGQKRVSPDLMAEVIAVMEDLRAKVLAQTERKRA